MKLLFAVVIAIFAISPLTISIFLLRKEGVLGGPAVPFFAPKEDGADDDLDELSCNDTYGTSTGRDDYDLDDNRS